MMAIERGTVVFPIPKNQLHDWIGNCADSWKSFQLSWPAGEVNWNSLKVETSEYWECDATAVEPWHPNSELFEGHLGRHYSDSVDTWWYIRLDHPEYHGFLVRRVDVQRVK